uniref:Uncharacterized protein n=1 Tax=Euplotes crassus TaxID=5936 RepID=A0A7S3KQ97_EUPCR
MTPKSYMKYHRKMNAPSVRSPEKMSPFSPLKMSAKRLISDSKRESFDFCDSSIPLSQRIRNIRLKAKNVKDKAIKSIVEGIPKLETKCLPNIYQTPKK